MNLATAKNKIFMLIDSYSKSGVIQSQTDTKHLDYTYKIPLFLDQCQKQVATIKKIVKAKKISHNMPQNSITDYPFDIVQHLSSDQTYEAVGALAYYFEVDDAAIVYIEEKINNVWTLLSTITNPLVNAGYYTAYKGLITASNITNTIRIRFAGTTGYNHRNRALFSYPFSDITRIPDYKQYVLYNMPDNFYQINKVVMKGQVRNAQGYENTKDYYWEQKNIIALAYDTVAEYSIEYFAYPTDITSSTPDIYEFEIDADAQEALPFYTASKLLLQENQGVSDRLLAEYNSIVANLDTKVSNNANSVVNTLFSRSQTGIRS